MHSNPSVKTALFCFPSKLKLRARCILFFLEAWDFTKRKYNCFPLPYPWIMCSLLDEKELEEISYWHNGQNSTQLYLEQWTSSNCLPSSTYCFVFCTFYCFINTCIFMCMLINLFSKAVKGNFLQALVILYSRGTWSRAIVSR